MGVTYPSPAEIGLKTTCTAKANARPFYLAWRDVPSPLEPLARYLARQEHPKVLLSTDFLLHGDADFMRRLVETARISRMDVVALVYVREQREWLISLYAQSIKSRRWTMSLEQFLEESFARGVSTGG